MVSANLGLLPQWRDQTVALAAMLHALADCVHLRIIGLHGIVDDDTTLTIDTRLLGQFDVRPDANGHHHQIGRDFQAILETHGADPLFAEHGGGIGTHQKTQAAFFQTRAQHVRRNRVELAFHQGIEHMHHGHLHALLHQAVGRFQPEQATADHHCVLAGLRRRQHGFHVLDVAKPDDAR